MSTPHTRPATRLLASALLGVVALALPAAAQTVVNGSMTGPTTSYPWNGDPPDGWTNNGAGTTDVMDPAIDTYGLAWVPSADGGTFVHAIGYTKTTHPGEMIWQTITDLEPGHSYTVCFEQSITNRFSGPLDIGGYWRVSIAGVTYDSAPLYVPALGVAVPWGLQSFKFVATETEHELLFHAKDLENDPSTNKKVSLGLDGVSVHQGQAPCGWTDFLGGLPGLHGTPHVIATGNLGPGDPNELHLTKAAENSLAGLFVAPQSVPVAFKGGTLLAFPSLPPVLLPTGPQGRISLFFDTPQGLPPELQIWVQYAIQDHAAPQGVALSNAVVGVTP